MMLQEHGIEFGRGGVRAALGQSFVGGRCAREAGVAEGGAAPDLPGEGSLEDAPRPEGETADEGGEVRARKRQKAILEEDD